MKLAAGFALAVSLALLPACEASNFASASRSKEKKDEAAGLKGKGADASKDEDAADKEGKDGKNGTDDAKTKKSKKSKKGGSGVEDAGADTEGEGGSDDDLENEGGGESDGLEGKGGEEGKGDEDLGSAGGLDAEDFAAIDKSLTKDEGEIVGATPGVKAVRVGVNFEDQGVRGDKDHNDAVLCFSGKFKVDSSNVVSIRNQTVVGTTSSHSDCRHMVRVEITHKDGSKEPSQEFDSRNTAPVSMNLKVGSKIEVFMKATLGDGCDPGVEKNMHDAVDCEVAANVCNTMGQ